LADWESKINACISTHIALHNGTATDSKFFWTTNR